MNSVTHYLDTDGIFKRKPVERKTKKRRKIVPAKGKTSWGRIYPDGREVCSDTPKGLAEYKRRTLEMAERQNCRCKCGVNFLIVTPTFGHDATRGMGGAIRDDRIEIDGKSVNHAECWNCNSEKGSKRLL